MVILYKYSGKTFSCYSVLIMGILITSLAPVTQLKNFFGKGEKNVARKKLEVKPYNIAIIH